VFTAFRVATACGVPCVPAVDGVIVVRNTRLPAARAASANRTSPASIAAASRPAAMSLVPTFNTTSVAPSAPATSPANRACGGGPPTPSARSSLREIPALRTVIVVSPPAAARRVARASVQRASASGAVPTPSVIESPTATTACTGRGASTSTPLSSSQDVVGVPGAPPRGASHEVCRATGCALTTAGNAGTAIVTASRPAATTATGSLTASAPGGITVPACPPNVTGCSVPTAAFGPPPAPAADTAATDSGADPYALESRTRSCAPPTWGRTTIRSVPPPATARGGVPGCMAACHAVTQVGPHAAAATARGRTAVPRHPTSVTTTAATLTTTTASTGRGRAGTCVSGTTARSGRVTMSRTSDSRLR
jgi:hypothetical protein